MWLPLALADLVSCVEGFVGRRPGRAEVLESWALPELAAALRNDMEEVEADQTVAGFNRLAAMFGGSKR